MSFALLHPEGAWLFVLLPLCWWFLRQDQHQRGATWQQAFPERADRMAAMHEPRAARWMRVGGGSALILAIVAYLEPTFGAPEAPRAARGTDIVFCLDLSRSMQAADLEPTRLEAARKNLIELCTHAVADRFALVIFAGEARLRSPLTRDLASFAALVSAVDVTDLSSGGSDLDQALELAAATLERASNDAQAIVLLTDGEDPTGSARSRAIAFGERNLPVHTLGFGTELGSKIALGRGSEIYFLRDSSGRDVITRLQPASLEALSRASGGTYARGDAAGKALVALHDAAIAPRAVERDAEQIKKELPQRFRFPLLPAVVTGILLLGISKRRVRRAVFP
jgi:Ca-activated chloride channel family protein